MFYIWIVFKWDFQTQFCNILNCANIDRTMDKLITSTSPSKLYVCLLIHLFGLNLHPFDWQCLSVSALTLTPSLYVLQESGSHFDHLNLYKQTNKYLLKSEPKTCLSFPLELMNCTFCYVYHRVSIGIEMVPKVGKLSVCQILVVDCF